MKHSYSIEVGGKTLTLEIGGMADQANAAVLAKYGETAALATVVMSKRDAATDYMPLKVDYEERFYAAGKIIGSRFIRRESRPSEEAILAGRLVDRAVRPLFDHRLRREMQVVVTVLAYDEENEPEFVGLLGASAALAISDIPWNGPVAGVRVAKISGKFAVNPTNSELANPGRIFDAFVAGPNGLINMIELGGSNADGRDVLEAFRVAQKEIDHLAEFQKKIAAEIGAPKAEVALVKFDAELEKAAGDFLAGTLEEAVSRPSKLEHKSSIAKLKDDLMAYLKENLPAADLRAADFIFEEEINKLVHKKVLREKARPDGRKFDEVRGLQGEVGLFARTHGSALFMRGDTQALAVTTLAPPGQEQMIETMETTGKRRFMLHYNFPPYSVGEIGPFRGPGRREIGHGNLARKAVEALLPAKEEFPYTIRVVSEILSSNGSSSMATVCASVMSLMDAGVPLKDAAAGIAMGLMIEHPPKPGGKTPHFEILADIQGPEDHHGDMDFKAAGTEKGINAVQMDVKVDGLNLEILEKALHEAQKARTGILRFMKTVIAEPRPELSRYVPAISFTQIAVEKIGALIGPGGKVINGLIAKYGLVAIDVEEDGRVFVSGSDPKSVEEAMKEIASITREFKVGEIVEGKIIKLLDFGAIMDLGGGKDGMIHVSELKNGYVKNVSDVLKVGDFVRAKIIRADEDGRIGLSLRQL